MNDFNKIYSKIVPINDVSNVEELIKEYDFILVINRSGVAFSKVSNGYDISKAIEIRAFDENKELHAVNFGDKFLGRIRIDSKCEDNELKEIDTFDCEYLLWGRSDGKGNLTEDRGTVVPSPIDIEKGKRATLKIRNYLSADSFEFVDFRICGIVEVSSTESEGGNK